VARSVLEQLIVELSTDNTKLTAGLRQAEQVTQTSAQRLGASARQIGIATAAVAGAVAAVGTAYIAAANRAASYADEVDKAALRTRLSRQSVQELRFVTDQLGGSFATVETAVVGLTQRLAGAEQGSERQTEAFKRLGIATRDASGNLRSTEDILFDSISALQGVENETQRAVLAQEVFGRSAAQLGPILASGAGSVDELRKKANDLGLVLDNQSIGSLVAYKDQLSAVQQQFGAVQRELTLAFLPVLTEQLLPAIETGLRIFRDLPEPVRNTGIAVSTAGIALSAAAVAARALGVALTPLTGGLGLLALVTVGVASLAAEVLNANPTLDAQKTAIQELKDEYARYRGELVITSEVERQAALDRLNTLRGEVQARLTLLAEIARQEQQRAQSLIDSPLLQFLLPGFVNVQGGARQDTLAEIQSLSGTLNSLNLDQFLVQSGANRLVAPPPPVVTPPPGATGGGGASRGSAPRTVADVFEQLGLAGTALNRIAAFDQTPEALLRAAEGRFRLLDGAVQELLTDFADKVTDAELANIRARRDAVLAEIARLSLDVERQASLAPNIAGIGSLDTPLTREQLREQLRRQTLISGADLGALLFPPDENAALIASVREAGTLRRQAFTIEAGRTAEAEAAANQVIIDSVRQAGAFRRQAYTIEANRTAQAEAAANQVIIDSVREAGVLRRQAYTIQAGLDAEAARALASRIADPFAGAGGVNPGRGFQSDRRTFTPSGLFLRGDPFASAPGVAGDQRGRQAARDAEEALDKFSRAGSVAQDAFRQSALRQQEAADVFANTVVQSSFTFANGLVDSIRNGDIGQAFQSAFSAASGIVGAGSFGNLSILGGSIPIAGLLSGAIGLIGSLFGGLFGNNRSDAVPSRAAGAAARGAPAIEINFTNNQSLNIQSLTGDGRLAVDGITTDAIRRFEQALASITTRLTSVEARTA
jgi:hypothetical protein